MAKNSNEARKRRQRRIRNRISGTPERPRLNVFRSLEHIYAQVIDDVAGQTLVSASTVDKEIARQVAGKKKQEQAAIVGQVVAQRALDAGIQEVVFDRGGYLYHGRIKAVADGARKGGLKL